MLLLGLLFIPESFALTEGITPQPKDYIFYTFSFCSIAFAALIILAYKEYKWLHYVAFSFLLIINAAAIDGSIAYLVEANEYLLKVDFVLWVLPFLLTTAIASYGFMVIAWLLELPHPLTKLKPLFFIMSLVAAIFCLSTFFWLEKIALSLMWVPANILFFGMVACQILPPLTWPAYSQGLRLFIRVYPVIATIFAIVGYWSISSAEVASQHDFNNLYRWLLLLVAFFSLTIVIWQAFNSTRLKETAERKAIEAAKNEAEMQLALLKADQAYNDALCVAAQHQKQLATVSHDLKQPITALRMAADRLHREKSNDAGKLAKAIDYIDTLSRSYLSEERPAENLEQPGDLEMVSTAMFIDTLRQMFALEASQKNIRLKFIGMQHTILVEPLVVMRIMTNLIGNAFAHAKATRILVGFRGKENKIVFQVHDNGCGIAEENKTSLFAPGEKGNESKGHGLGLSIVQELCRAQGLSFRLESQQGSGTSAYVVLPRAKKIPANQ